MDFRNLRGPLPRWKSATFAFLLGMWTLAPAFASDTEVYAREVDFSGDVTPVMMMVLDSSGSMRDCLENCPGGITRIGALREAMRKVLLGEPEPTTGQAVVKPAPDFVKMGYVRFNPDANDGGWTRYPALRLGSFVPDSFTERSSLEGRLASDADDVSGTTFDGTTYGVGSGMNALGLRFADLQIPRNATITGAVLHFTRSDSDRIPGSLKLAIDKTGNSVAFGGDGVADRTSWSSDSSLSTDEGVGTFFVDVTDLVQDVVNRSDWCGGNALGLRVKADGGSRLADVWAREGNKAAAPYLIISYSITGSQRTDSCITAPIDMVLGIKHSFDDIEWPEGGAGVVSYRPGVLYPAAIPDAIRNHVGLRFPNIPVLSDSTIEKAWLYVTSSTTDTAAAMIEVRAFATSNLAPFCTEDTVTHEVSCTAPVHDPTSASATLTLPANASSASTDGIHRAIDVKDLVAEVTSRPGWNPGNALGFRLRSADPNATSSNSTIYAVDSTLSRAAYLHIVARKRFTNLNEIDKTARQDLYDDVNARLYASGGTPLGDAYAEAARYMLGMQPYITDTFTSTFDDQTVEQTYYQPDPRTASAGRYVSPLEQVSECSANYIYLMSDGEPNNASNVNNNSGGITSGYNAACNAYSRIPSSSGNASANFACMVSVAQHLASGNNQKRALIRTNTVLFDNALTGAVVTDMERVAKDYGKGKFFHAKTSSQLTDSLLSSLTMLIDQSGSMTAPGVAVNQFNRLTHLDQLYYSVFDPEPNRARWLGNVKRYRLEFIETPNGDGTTTDSAQIVDALGNNAVDSATSFFSSTARSFWSDVIDGDKATLGGAASRLPAPASRVIYTNVNADAPLALQDLRALTTTEVSDATTLTGLSATQFNNLRNWLLGYRIDIVDTTVFPNVIRNTAVTVSSTTLPRNQIGGVLHSQPLLVSYGYSGSDPNAAAGNAALQDNTVYFSDMDGMLHAVNANTGVEVFAFMPRELLQRADEVAINAAQTLPEFGLDLTWTVWRKDANNDLRISAADGDHVLLFGGMRMGGSNYYALDVTNRSSPRLKWVIRGGSSGAFANLGQTWSRPALAKVKIAGVEKTVMFFGGGYDPKHETAGFNAVTNAADTKGNQLYIVDPDTGSVLWWASNTAAASLTAPAMKFSITAEPRVVDTDRDGFVDAVYVGDLGGQVWRIDLDNANTGAAGLGVRARLLANLGQGGTANSANHRRFYEPPSVALARDPAGESYLTVALGSGYRSHPLDTATQDYFYVLKDRDALRTDLLTTSTLQATITQSDLGSIDLNSTAGAGTAAGWKLALPGTGEKVLAAAISLFGEVLFTTYVPDLSSSSTCAPVIGLSNLYRVSLFDGAAVDTNGDGVIDSRSLPGLVHGMAGPPQVLVGSKEADGTGEGRNVIITGTGVIRNRNFGGAVQRLRWYEKFKSN
ncbi:MAG: Tfp pilus assembly protein tip-associated adhesin PilY1-like protein [Moraxellaceae bacterium]|jgi:type IV pilus assembly protein PilY1|nr:Tfp pilus assembly protein tip-associated adhesin PilY1-like protein [Moraxellaceae bacterium]